MFLETRKDPNQALRIKKKQVLTLMNQFKHKP